ncbi:SGNH/GDSL hydrolase family protein [Microvirga pudoricolor]|uniref:SGNH/GDSL hydrolase family protein n=1 Tax=Microvirga pudoricolor TaxID=2778729 RepID=UPI00194F6F00|nr:GDSL-type esterase/lipase family protein [Microvirga pudoricolor]MBM6596424.1 SGNH/GDSL hydrolase family protein [Microvirga pudoricolor]
MADQPNPFAPHWLIRDIVIGSHMQAAGPDGLLFLGDSIVEGFYPGRIAGLPVVNAGFSGIWCEALEPKVERLVANARPRIVALLVGTNDAKKGQGPAEVVTVAGFYERILAILSATGLPLIAVTPPPVELGKRLTTFYAPDAMTDLSRHAARLARAAGATVVDIHAAFQGDGAGAREGTTVDGIHLSAASYRRLHAMLEAAATAILQGSQSPGAIPGATP